jgi:hypothetical protein
MSRDNPGPLAWTIIAILAMYLGLSTKAIHAQPAEIAPRMSGQMLLDRFQGPPNLNGKPLTGLDQMYRTLAQGYLHGINDATEGRDWCYTGRIKPDELDDRVISALKNLPADILSGNAAPLVVNFLRHKYPCTNQI